jgi:hypothetical protein
MFGYQKNGIYCSWAPPFIAFATQQRSKQLGAAFVATVLQHSKQWHALQQRDNQPFPFPFSFSFSKAVWGCFCYNCVTTQ